MKLLETTKLFYDEYPYKLTILNSLGYIFREKNFKFARDNLDELQLLYERNEPLIRGSYRQKSYDVETFKECKTLFTMLNTSKDYRIRVEVPLLQLYSHDKDWLMEVKNVCKNSISFHEPKSVLARNTIISFKPVEYEYKVTLSDNPDPALANWIQSNPELAKAGQVCLDEIKHGGYVKGFYFYVRDERILGLVNLMLGKVSRIDKIVYSQT